MNQNDMFFESLTHILVDKLPEYSVQYTSGTSISVFTIFNGRFWEVVTIEMNDKSLFVNGLILPRLNIAIDSTYRVVHEFELADPNDFDINIIVETIRKINLDVHTIEGDKTC